MENLPDSKIYDIVVSGMGIYGASILYHTASQGKQILGIERYKIGENEKNSSGGEIRLTRQQVFEGTVYPEIAAKSQQIIREIEKITGEKLQYIIGALNMGRPDSKIITGIKENEKKHGQKQLTLNSQEIMEKYPALQPPQDFVGILEEGAGYVFIEKLLQYFVDLALKNQNAFIQDETELLGYEQKQDYIEIQTNKGIIKTKKLILAQGIGMVNILRELGVPIKAQKNQTAWLKWEEKQVMPENLTGFYFDYSPEQQIYGFPNAGTGLKIGFHLRGEEYTDTSNVNFDYDKNLLQELSQVSKNVLKGINWEPENIDRVKACFYTLTEDEQFVIDFHPQNQNVVLVSACSGHGFKYSPQLGCDIVAMTDTNKILYQEFSINRFNK